MGDLSVEHVGDKESAHEGIGFRYRTAFLRGYFRIAGQPVTALDFLSRVLESVSMIW